MKMKKLVAVVFVLSTLVVMVLFSRAQDREQQLVNDRHKAECVFSIRWISMPFRKAHLYSEKY